jgi:GH35 family endo-1,4-beta-xylanase
MKSTAYLITAVLFVSAISRAADPLSAEAIEQRIQKHRTAEATFTVLSPDGSPLASQPVTIRQTRHKFLFGCNAFEINTADTSDLQRAYQRRFAALFNYATLPFYWGAYEYQPGKPNEENLRGKADWCVQNGIRAKGHPLCWHEVQPKWLDGQPTNEVLRLQLNRIRRDIAAFNSTIHIWDVLNEAVVMPDAKNAIGNLCRSLGQLELIRRTFAEARRADPKAVLILNDFIINEKFQNLIRECLNAGVPIDAIGIQSHMHDRYWGAKETWDTCEQYKRFGKPIHFTETTILSRPDDEQEQARQVEEFYRVLFSHPSVEAITWWDFSDFKAWKNAAAGLVRKDMTPKPSYDILLRLVKNEWWTREIKTATDTQGKVRVRGFLGDYRIECSYWQGAFTLDRNTKAATIQVR